MANKRKKVSGVIKPKEKNLESFITSSLFKKLFATLLVILSFVAFQFFDWKFGIIIFGISGSYLTITVLYDLYSRIENIFK